MYALPTRLLLKQRKLESFFANIEKAFLQIALQPKEREIAQNSYDSRMSTKNKQRIISQPADLLRHLLRSFQVHFYWAHQ